ncbi:MAG: NAD(+)/NADH kinase [Nanoarchaeota archaeon]
MYLVISKADRQSAELAKIALSYLRENKLKYDFEKEITAAKNEYEIAIAIGDDRFILETFRKLGKSQIPLFAAGSSQSFLAQANALNLKHYLNLIKKKKYTIFKRSRLIARFDKITTSIALNDIGLFSSKSASLLEYSLVLNDEIFRRDSSDGIVVATPTGSTGYSLSAGGPIVLDEPNIFTITSISSLEKHSPLVVSDNTKIKIKDIEGFNPTLIIDGEVRMPVHSGELIIEKSPYGANFVIFSKEYQLESRLKKRTIHTNISKLKDLPASAKLVYKILAHEGNMTQKDLIDASLLPERTVRYALALLMNKELIDNTPHFSDARQTVYGV